MDSAEMSSVQFHRVQVSRAGVAGQGTRSVSTSRHPLRQLLAAVLLVCKGKFIMNNEDGATSNPGFSSGHTSNDLLFRLRPESSQKSLNYEIVAQSSDEVQDVRNAPPFSIGPYLIESEQTRLLTKISIYSERGGNRDQVRLLYMNAAAVRIWKAMGRNPTMVGAQHRPPRTALLMYGVPFSD
jgi:hypothetical protein